MRRNVSTSAVTASTLAAIALAVVSTSASSALATNSIRTAFANKYPGSTLLARTQAAQGSSCYACHQPPNTSANGNCYKEALTIRINAGRSAAQALADVEALDSDGDGFSNKDEILLARTDMAGQVGYNPGLIGATGTDPCAANTTVGVTGQLETPPPAPCRADFNADGFLDFTDFDDFVIAFEAGAASGDFNADGFLDFTDFDDFVTAFEAGC